MRILCISDTTRSLAFSDHVKDIYRDVDLVISAGDMPLECYDYVSTMLNCDLYYVFGNHNLTEFRSVMHLDSFADFRKGVDDCSQHFYGFMTDGKCHRDKKTGLIVAGLGGSMLYNGGDSQYTERQMRRRIRRLIPVLLYNRRRYGRYLDILITHAPPFGMGDREDMCHRGFRAFVKFIDRFEPKYVLHGHIHLDDRNASRILKRGKTTIINVFGSYLLEDTQLGEKDNDG